MNENNRFEWSGDLSVNNEIIDKQHMHIFTILDQLNMQLPEDAKNNQFARILTELTDYGLTHLKEEEKLMTENQ